MSDELKPYYTLLVPYVPYKLATEWHPTEDTGPFKVLTRGAFQTIEEAVAWGKAKLNGTPYSIHYTDEDGLRTGHRADDPPRHPRTGE